MKQVQQGTVTYAQHGAVVSMAGHPGVATVTRVTAPAAGNAIRGMPVGRPGVPGQNTAQVRFIPQMAGSQQVRFS
jgi:hypothetical protein